MPPTHASGVTPDREWLVVNEAKRFCTGRNFPQMLTLSCSPFEPNRDLDAATLAATTASELPPFIRIVATLDDTVPPLYLPLDERYLPTTELSTAPLPEAPLEAHVVEVVVWRSTCEAEDMGDVAAQWFSHLLHQPVRLVRATARVRPRLVGDEPKKHVLCVAPESDITACTWESRCCLQSRAIEPNQPTATIYACTVQLPMAIRSCWAVRSRWPT